MHLVTRDHHQAVIQKRNHRLVVVSRGLRNERQRMDSLQVTLGTHRAMRSDGVALPAMRVRS
jgi:hypothetical protein